MFFKDFPILSFCPMKEDTFPLSGTRAEKLQGFHGAAIQLSTKVHATAESSDP